MFRGHVRRPRELPQRVHCEPAARRRVIKGGKKNTHLACATAAAPDSKTKELDTHRLASLARRPRTGNGRR